MADLNLLTAIQKELPSLQWLGSLLFHLFIILFNNYKYNEKQKEADERETIEEILRKIEEETEKVTGESSTKIAFPKEFEEITDFLKLAQYHKSPQYLLEFATKVFQYIQEEMPLQEQDSCEKIYSLEEYNKLFVRPYLKLPAIAKNFQDDETFAYMRVAGPNPVQIEQVTNITETYPNFPVTDEHYQPVMGAKRCSSLCLQIFTTEEHPPEHQYLSKQGKIEAQREVKLGTLIFANRGRGGEAIFA